MKVIKSEKKLCLVCMEEHKVETVALKDKEEFKGEKISFEAIYEYCPHADEYLETQEMVKLNSLAMKDGYREKKSLLTSKEIQGIRKKYKVSQKDFSVILDWGKATITRYENHQVQDRAHDDVLRKIDSDPKWFLEMLKRSENGISKKAYKKYYKEAIEQFKKKKDQYLIDFIHSLYAKYNDESLTGNTSLNLRKIVEMINYISLHTGSLYKVKLMKMLWYSDNLHYKRFNKAISGLAYRSLPMGAVPEGHDQIIQLDGVEYDLIEYNGSCGYKFKTAEGFQVKELAKEELEDLDTVISELGNLTSEEIISKMHGEEAYKNTASNCIIPFSFAEKLTIE